MRNKKLHAVEDLNTLILGEQHKQHLTDAQMAELAGITTRRYRYAKAMREMDERRDTPIDTANYR